MQMLAILLQALLVLVAAVMVSCDVIPIVSRTEERDAAGQYSLSYQTGNGITVVEHGELKPTPDGKDHVLIKSGGYQYTSPEGKPVDIRYKADEFGYVATGDAIPVAPVA
ncbi:endocuticle structural glycoprotein SgAbd-2-like [Schistocerca piceifrons]|uniref:endocuticle structural glycoprotein SgAbd-2-like n=1 Tax=Schistocerca piceifrons TaxID=274613 RepID=UPI001F5F4105|nr:endocuticle structural glycoprotein SgAbd-2-like [Schistocerca piceifrons]